MGRRISLALALAVLPCLSLANEPREIDPTALRDAIRNNRSVDLEIVLEHGELLDFKATDGKTVLMAAAADGNNRLLRALLDSGANPHVDNNRGGTALMYAAAAGAADCVRTLLERDVSVNARADNGWTAITLASAKGHRATVELLLDHGADPNAPDAFGWTPLMRATQNRRREAVAALLRSPRVDPARVNSMGRDALHIAMEQGHCEIARTLAAAGLDPDRPDFSLHTARSLAPAPGGCLPR